ncbi:hypothetical protein Tco_0567988 [Tanacetum coccineum]
MAVLIFIDAEAENQVQLVWLVDNSKPIADEAANEENNRVLDLEHTKTTQALEIESLKRRVNKLEKKQRSRTYKLKRLFKVGRTAQVVSSKDEDVFNGEEVITEQDVVEKEVSTADPVTTTGEVVTMICVEGCIVVIQEPVQSTATTVPSTIPKAKSITFRDPDESTTRPTLTPIPSNIKDKGKSKMIKPEKPLKKTKQIRLDEELAFKL